MPLCTKVSPLMEYLLSGRIQAASTLGLVGLASLEAIYCEEPENDAGIYLNKSIDS